MPGDTSDSSSQCGLLEGEVIDVSTREVCWFLIWNQQTDRVRMTGKKIRLQFPATLTPY